MVGQAELFNQSTFTPAQEDFQRLSYRKILIYTLGLADSPLTFQRLHVLSKNLADRLRKYYDVPSPFEDLVQGITHKMIRNKVISTVYDNEVQGYTYKLTDAGEAEHDLDMYKLSKTRAISIVNEFMNLLKYAL